VGERNVKQGSPVMFEILALLTLLQIKHWYVDFVIQTPEEIATKGTYGAWPGIWHSVKHGIGTLVVMLIVFSSSFFVIAVLLGILDGVVHYHIDWAKMNWGEQDMSTPRFWHHLGADQMAHQLTYVAILSIMLL